MFCGFTTLFQKTNLLLLSIVMLLALVGCRLVEKAISPSNFRNWTAEQAKMPTAQFQDPNHVVVHNVRNCSYLDEETFVVNYKESKIDVRRVNSVDFFVIPFKSMPIIAHTMISFGYLDETGKQNYLATSVEVRKENDESYSPWKGSARQYELIYVLADEKDVIQLRAIYQEEDVYLYRTVATPAQAQSLFVDVMKRVNQLAKTPEFYDTITNNCTTNIVEHINGIKPDRVLYDYRILLPGFSDALAYEQGLIIPHGTFEATKQRALINKQAKRYVGQENFSELIRQ